MLLVIFSLIYIKNTGLGILLILQYELKSTLDNYFLKLSPFNLLYLQLML